MSAECGGSRKAFEKAQAPWAKRKEKIVKYRRTIETHVAHIDALRSQTARDPDSAKKLHAALEEVVRGALLYVLF